MSRKRVNVPRGTIGVRYIEAPREFKKDIARLAKLSLYTEEQVLKDLIKAGMTEIEELYGEIHSFRMGGDDIPQEIAASLPPEEPARATTGILDLYPQVEERQSPDPAEAALNGLGDIEERPGQLAESEAVVVRDTE